eukprot:8049440-Alexandrium_andersonii.AAC.1
MVSPYPGAGVTVSLVSLAIARASYTWTSAALWSALRCATSTASRVGAKRCRSAAARAKSSPR